MILWPDSVELVWKRQNGLRYSIQSGSYFFQVYVRIKDEEWNVYKRYKQFNELHSEMKKKYPLTGKYEFPPKKSFGKKVRLCVLLFYNVPCYKCYITIMAFFLLYMCNKYNVTSSKTNARHLKHSFLAKLNFPLNYVISRSCFSSCDKKKWAWVVI